MGVNTKTPPVVGNERSAGVVPERGGGRAGRVGIAADHTVWEHSPSGNKQLSALLTATQLSATQTQQGIDEVFMTLTDGSFWEYSTAFPINNPFKELFTSGAASIQCRSRAGRRECRQDGPAGAACFIEGIDSVASAVPRSIGLPSGRSRSGQAKSKAS